MEEGSKEKKVKKEGEKERKTDPLLTLAVRDQDEEKCSKRKSVTEHVGRKVEAKG